MMTTLKRVINSALALTSYGTFGYDSTDNKPKFVDEGGNVYSLTSDGLRDQNMGINGGFDYAQRQVPGTLTTYSQTAARQYGADRWTVTNENASVQYRRVDTSAAPQTGITARYYGEYTKITSTGKLEVSQAIEAGNCLHLRSKTIRVQVKLRCSASKTIRMLLLQLTAAGTLDTIPGIVNAAPSGTYISAHGANGTDPTFGTNLSKIAPVTTEANGTIANSGLSCAVTTTFQRFSATFALPSDFKNLVVVFVSDSQFSAADRLEITEFGLYDGTEIRDWAERMQVAQQLNVQRYYQKSFNADTSPAQNAGLTGAERGHVSVAAAVANQPIGVDFIGSMRGAPGTSAFVFYNPSAANAFVRNTTAGSDATATAVANAGDSGFDILFTGIAAWTIAQSVAIHWSCDNEI